MLARFIEDLIMSFRPAARSIRKQLAEVNGLLEEDDLDEAYPLYLRIIAEAKENKVVNMRFAKALQTGGEHFIAARQTQRAILVLREALRLQLLMQAGIEETNALQWVRLRLAEALGQAGKFDEAEQLTRHVLDFWKDYNTELVSDPILVLADLYLAQGLLEKAEALYRRIFEAILEYVPEMTKKAAPVLGKFDAFYAQTGRDEERRKLMERVIATIDASEKDKPSNVGLFSGWLADQLQLGGYYELALTMRRHIMAKAERLIPPGDRNLVKIAIELAQLCDFQDLTEEACTAYQKAVAYTAARKVSDDVLWQDQSLFLLQTVRLLRIMGRVRELETSLDELLKVESRRSGEESEEVISILLNFGEGLLVMNEPELAERLLRRALSLSEKVYGPDRPELAKPMTLLAKADWSRDEFARADLQAKQAIALVESSLGLGHVETIIPTYITYLCALDDRRLGDMKRIAEQLRDVQCEIFGADSEGAIGGWRSVALADFEARNEGGVRSAFQKVIGILETEYGANADELIEPLVDFGNMLRRFGHRDDARKHLDRARRISADEKCSVAVSDRWQLEVRLGQLRREHSNGQIFADWLKDADERIHSKQCNDPLGRIENLLTAGSLLYDDEEFENSLAVYETALASLDQLREPSRRLHARIHLGRGLSLRGLRRTEEANNAFSTARPFIIESGRTESQADCEILLLQAHAWLKRDNGAEPPSVVEETVSELTRHLGGDHPETQRLRNRLSMLATA